MTALRSLLATVAVLVLTMAACADEMRGRILRVDPDKKELQIAGLRQARGEVQTFTLDAKTQVMLGNQTKALADLTPGLRVRVLFERRDGKAVAQVVHLPVVLQLGQLAQRAPVPGPAPQAPPAAQDENTITGTLQRVSQADLEIVVIGPGPKGPQTETTILVTETVPVLKNGKDIGFGALQEGEKVAVKTEKKDGKLTAKSIHIGEAAAATDAPPPAPQRNFIPRLRQALQLADQLLQQMEQRQNLDKP